MTKVQSWSLAAFGLVALSVGVLLATVGGTSAQTSTPTPAPSEESSDSSDSGVTPQDGFRRGPGGHGLRGIKENAAEVLGLTEDELRAAFEDGQTLAEVAAAQGMSEDDLVSALVAAVTADLDERLAEGDITQEQYDDIVAGLHDRVAEAVNREPGTGHPGGGPGCGVKILENAAEVLGMTEDDLRTALQEGQTLAEIGEAQGISTDDLVAQLTAAATADLDEKLAAGDITQEQYDEVIAELPDRITAIVNGEAGFGHHGAPDGTQDGAGFRPAQASGGAGTDA